MLVAPPVYNEDGCSAGEKSEGEAGWWAFLGLEGVLCAVGRVEAEAGDGSLLSPVPGCTKNPGRLGWLAGFGGRAASTTPVKEKLRSAQA